MKEIIGKLLSLILLLSRKAEDKRFIKLMITKKYLFFYSIFLSALLSNAQTAVNGIIQIHEGVSVTEQGLGKFSNYGGGDINFEGIPNISVDIYKLKTGNFTLPVSLNYNPSSIKVASPASWVGFGWELGAGGVITRQINGIPDDIKRWGLGDHTGAVHAYGYLLYGAEETEKFHDNAPKYNVTSRLSRLAGSRYVFDNNLNQVTEYWDNAYGHKFDTEPDIFNINVGQLPGSQFVFNKEKKAKFLTHRNFHVDYSLSMEKNSDSPVSTRGITSFKVTDDAGNIYKFGLRDSLTSYSGTKDFTDQYETGSSYTWDAMRATTWYLTEIITYEGELIKFSYEDEMIYSRYYNLKARAFESNYQYGQIGTSETWARNKTKRLKSIETRFEKIEFMAGHKREDINNSYALTDINLYAKHNDINTLLKTFKLEYNYFEASDDVIYSFNSASLTNLYRGDTYGNYIRRLKLVSLKETNQALGISLSPYRFQYNESFYFPSIYSNQKDFWGYFNAKPNNHQFPKLYVYPNAAGYEKYTPFRKQNYLGTEYIMNGADRQTDENAVKAAVLEKIKFPTSGEVQYTFESNEFSWNGVPIKGNGLRIKQIKTVSESNESAIKNYKYTIPGTQLTSGIVFDLPQFGFVEKTYDYYSYPNPNGGGIHISPSSMNHSSYDFFKYFLSINSEPFFYSSIVSEAKTGYSFITEETEGNGKTIFTYSVEGKFGDTQYPVYKNYTLQGNTMLLENIIIEPVKVAEGYNYVSGSGIQPIQEIASLDTISMYAGLFTYPYLKIPNFSWNRGQIMNKATYSQNGGLLAEDIYEYAVVNTNAGDTLAIIPALMWDNPVNYTMAGIYWDNRRNWFWYGKYGIITDLAKVLNKTIHKQYNNSSSNSIDNEISYSYNPNITIKSIVKRLSKYSTRTNFTYPLDIYTPESNFYDLEPEAMAISELKFRNRISFPIEEYTELLNEDNISQGIKEANYTEYRIFDGIADPTISMSSRKPSSLVLPHAFSSIDNLMLIKNFTKAQYSFSTINVAIDQHYTPKKIFENYVQGGKLTLLYENNKPQTFLWGYKGLYPVAKIDNLGTYDYAYTSFETKDEKGGWEFNNGFHEDHNDNPNIQSDYAVTGKRAYYFINSYAGISKNNLNPSKKYIVSFWYSSANGFPQLLANQVLQLPSVLSTGLMNYAEFEISNSTSLTITSYGTDLVIDELRLWPKDSEMTTYSYEPLVGIKTMTDAKGQTTYYDYDLFNRLKSTRDQKGNILKSYNYHIKP